MPIKHSQHLYSVTTSKNLTAAGFHVYCSPYILRKWGEGVVLMFFPMPSCAKPDQTWAAAAACVQTWLRLVTRDADGAQSAFAALILRQM